MKDSLYTINGSDGNCGLFLYSFMSKWITSCNIVDIIYISTSRYIHKKNLLITQSVLHFNSIISLIAQKYTIPT